MYRGPLFRHVGGKSKWARRLLPLFPEHECYVEPFAGAANLFLAKEPSQIEVLNDLDGDIVNYMRCVRERPYELAARLFFQPYSRAERASVAPAGDEVERAARWFFLKQSSFGGGGPKNGFATGARSSNNAVAFANRVIAIVEQACRLRDAIIECLDFEEVIRRYDRPTTFFYVDPPYVDTAGYDGLDFNERDHIRLARTVESIRGRALINYYDHPLIRELYQGWRLVSFDAPVHLGLAHGSRRRAQLLCLMNYDIPDQSAERPARPGRWKVQRQIN